MREKIKSAALITFDKYGFYRAGIRDIAAGAGCSLPTLYYYYKNKEDLYETAVCEMYKEINDQINDQIPEGIPLKDSFYFSVMQRILLDGDEKRVFRLALKGLMGVDGHERAREKLLGMEKEYRARNLGLIKAKGGDPAFARLLLRLTDHMLQQALLDEAGITGDQIKEEFDLLFSLNPEPVFMD